MNSSSVSYAPGVFVSPLKSVVAGAPRFGDKVPRVLTACLFLFFAMAFGSLYAQTPVTVAGAHASSNGSYATLKAAFDAINGQTQTGNAITVTITDNTTETVSAVLNAGAWTTLTIHPTVTGKSISGALAGVPLIDLSGADNVTIDGRVNATGGAVDLLISNTSTSATAGTSTIRFINDACSNVVQYCLIEGSSTDANAGIIFFSTASAGGNDNNTVSNNNITADTDTNRPLNAIFSLGSASNENSGNSISNNNIYNFFSRSGTASQGILLSSNTTSWIINGNSFYETAGFTPTAATSYSAIYINNTSGITFRINDNFIGGTSASCGGTAWIKNGATSGINNVFYGIRCNVGASDSSRLYNNRIRNWSWTNSASAAWYGIAVEAGQVNIGNSGGNWIGDTTGTGNITYTAGRFTAAVGNFYGIHVSGADNVSIRNNRMGSITVANYNSGWSSSFYGINKIAVAGTLTVSNNMIGSGATANSIRCSSTSTSFISAESIQLLYGIYSLGTGMHTVDGNTISRLTNSMANTGPLIEGVVRGIHMTGHASGSAITNNTVQHLTIANNYSSYPVIGIYAFKSSSAVTISRNTVHSLSNTYQGFGGEIAGIYFRGLNNANSTINANFLYNIFTTTTTTNPNIYGIYCFQSDVILSNNIISMAGNFWANITGIYVLINFNFSDESILFNTVYLSGTLSQNGSSISSCLYLTGGSSSSNFHYAYNNIFYNARTNSGSATGSHYALYSSFSTNLFINHNNYYAGGTGGIVGYWPSSNRTTLADLQAANGQDYASTNVNVVFTNAGGTTPGSYLPTSAAANLVLTANLLTSITTDYTGATRTFYSMGAYDFAVNQPVVQVTATLGTATADYPTLRQALDAVNAGTHQGVIEVKITTNVTDNQTATLYQSGYNGTSSYTSLSIYPTAANLLCETTVNGVMLDLNGADNVTLDGRVNRTGSTVSLIFMNSSTGSSANTIRFINGAQSNTIRYTSVRGGASALSGTPAVIHFSTSTSGSNSSNTIEYCSIAGQNASLRYKHGIYSSGSASPNDNTSNTIRYNEFSNFFIFDGAGQDVTAVGIYTNSSAWAISDNSFFMPSSISLFNGNYHVIYISTSGVNFTVNTNFIGGTSANCGGGTFTVTNGLNFWGIRLNVGTSTASNIQGNTIRKIAYTNSSFSNYNFILLEATAGNINIGTTTGNALGDSTTTGSIVFNRAGSSANNLYGINILSGGTVNCQNNIISGITIGPVNDNSAANFVGIRNAPSGSNTATISNNTIGSFNVANSINVTTTSGTSGQVQTVAGISSTTSATMNNNLISNLNNATNNATVGDAGRINGIRCTGGTHSMQGNRIRNLSIANASTASNQDASVGGIVISALSNHTLTANSITGLTNSRSDFAGHIHGLYYTGATGSAGNITRNFIQGLAATGASSVSATIYGIRHTNGQANYVNNIVAFGNNSPGTLYGIYDNGVASSAFNLYHNSVYLSGSPASGSLNSFAFYSNAANSARNIRNNIFSNARSNSGATGKHYAVFFNYAVSTNLMLDFNNYRASGTGGVLGLYNSADVASVPLISGLDASSKNVDPLFANAGGTAATDYRASEREQIGVAIAGITTDYTGATRTYYSMGAYDRPVFSLWTGSTSTAWTTTTNWTNGALPPSNPEVRYSATASRDLVLDANRSVKGLYFNGSSRKLVLGNFNLTVDSVITGANSASYVQSNGTGSLSKTINNAANFLFATGNATYNPVSITNNTGTSDDFTVRVADAVLKGGTSGTAVTTPRVDRTWHIGKTNPTASAGNGVDMAFQWETAQESGTMAAYRLNHHSGSGWVFASGYDPGSSEVVSGTSPKTHTFSGYKGGFSPFAIGGSGSSPLPIVLREFVGLCVPEGIQLNWITESEINNERFFVHRSKDMVQWEEVADIPGAGNSNSPLSYSVKDERPYDGINYYSLTQQDYDGKSERFDPISMFCRADVVGNALHVFPNPAEDLFTVFISVPHHEISADLEITDLNGRLVLVQKVKATQGGNLFQISRDHLGSGTYILRLRTEKLALSPVKVVLK